MEFPTARGEFAPYFLSPSDLSHQQQSEEEKLMVALGISDRNLFACKRQSSVSLNPAEILQQKPISLLTVFRPLPASSQIKQIPTGDSGVSPVLNQAVSGGFFTAFPLNSFHLSALLLLETPSLPLPFFPLHPVIHPFVSMFLFWEGMSGNV